MSRKTIAGTGKFEPTRSQMEDIDDNFTENYASIAAVESDVEDLQAGEGITLSEYADNAAAVTGGLSVGDLYTTTGAVKVVTE